MACLLPLEAFLQSYSMNTLLCRSALSAFVTYLECSGHLHHTVAYVPSDGPQGVICGPLAGPDTQQLVQCLPVLHLLQQECESEEDIPSVECLAHQLMMEVMRRAAARAAFERSGRGPPPPFRTQANLQVRQNFPSQENQVFLGGLFQAIFGTPPLESGAQMLLVPPLSHPEFSGNQLPPMSDSVGPSSS